MLVEAPASSANLGPGFDVFALALETPRDRLRLSSRESPRPAVEVIVRGNSSLPTDPGKNAAGAVAMKIAKERDLRFRMSIELEKRVPVGVGMGSSAASSVAAAYAMNRHFRLGMSLTEVADHAAYGELVCAGVEHHDNVAASALGGFVVVKGGAVREYTGFKPPNALKVCVVTPDVMLPTRKTEYARSLLPSKVDLQDLTRNVGAASLMVSGFAKKDIALIGKGMTDAIVEPARAAMIPGYWEVKRAAMAEGAAGTCISGAGPSVLAIVDSRKEDPARVTASIRRAFLKAGSKSEGFVTTVGKGARSIDIAY